VGFVPWARSSAGFRKREVRLEEQYENVRKVSETRDFNMLVQYMHVYVLDQTIKYSLFYFDATSFA
jgi:hypothetical protein